MNNLKLININKYINKYNIIKLFIIIYLLLLLILLRGSVPLPLGRGPSLLLN